MPLNPHAIRFDAVAVTLLSSLAAQAQTPAPPDAAVYFINLRDPFKVQFGLTGMGVAPAGVEKEKTGHHALSGLHSCPTESASRVNRKCYVVVRMRHIVPRLAI
jgi:hypothetical protein